MSGLKEFEYDVTSQNGEDGVLRELFRRLQIQKGSCVEFGAWDGRHLSNTWDLWHNRHWRTLLIEGDSAKYQVLRTATAGHDNVTALQRFVDSSGRDSLESILVEAEFHRELDLLSIDIDGDDLAVFESLRSVRPKIVVIEYNPTFPVEFVFQQQPGDRFGSSAAAVLLSAHRASYRLAHATKTNLILVDSDHFSKLGMREPRLEEVLSTSHLCSLVVSFDGRTMLLRKRLPFHPSPPAGGVWRLCRLAARRVFRRRRDVIHYDELVPVDVLAADRDSDRP